MVRLLLGDKREEPEPQKFLNLGLGQRIPIMGYTPLPAGPIEHAPCYTNAWILS